MRFKFKFSTIIYHVAGWIILYLLPPIILQSEIRLPSWFGDYVFWSTVIACFYLNYLWLIPRYLSKRKFGLYIVFILLMLVFTYFTNEFMVKQYHHHQEASHETSQNDNNEPKRKRPRFRGYNSVLFCLTVLGLGTSIKVTGSWYENEKQKKVMENQKLGAELSLLKSQINPHFFFNTLNSIYSLAIVKSDKTPEAIIKLSEIMRYIIYDTERKQVNLSKEAEYIANYIELQRLRLTKDVEVIYKTQLDKEESVIEPLLLLPFVENAFKHGIDIDKGGRILISLIQTGKILQLHVENPIVEDLGMTKNGSSGMGLNNTLKRLKLLYEDNFKLSSGKDGNKYVIDLVLKLKDNEMSDS